MPLNWSIEKVENNQELIDDPAERAITETIVFASIFVGLTRIIQGNVDLWEKRLAAYQGVGALMNRVVDEQIQPYFVTRKHIQRRIGLTTNASPLTDSAFKKNLLSRAQDAGLSMMISQEKREDDA